MEFDVKRREATAIAQRVFGLLEIGLERREGALIAARGRCCGGRRLERIHCLPEIVEGNLSQHHRSRDDLRQVNAAGYGDAELSLSRLSRHKSVLLEEPYCLPHRRPVDSQM